MKEATEAFEQRNYNHALNFYVLALYFSPPDKVSDIAILHYNIGVCYQKLKNNVEAKKEFSKAVEMKPNYLKPLASRMNILKIEGEYEQALEDAKKIHELDRNYPYPGLQKLIVELELLKKWKFKQMKDKVGSLHVPEEEKKKATKEDIL